MKVLFKWEESELFNGQDAFYIEVHKNDINDSILSKLGSEDGKRLEGEYIESVNRWAKNNPQLARQNHVYLLVPQDGTSCQLMEPYFPYSGQWNAYNPFLKHNKSITDLSELKIEDSANLKQQPPYAEEGFSES